MIPQEKKNNTIGVLLFIFFWFIGAERYYYGTRMWWAYTLIIIHFFIFGWIFAGITWIISLVFLIMDIRNPPSNVYKPVKRREYKANPISGDTIQLRFNLAYYSGILLWTGIFTVIGGGFILLLSFAFFAQSSIFLGQYEHEHDPKKKDPSKYVAAIILWIMGIIAMVLGSLFPAFGILSLIVSIILGYASVYKDGRKSATTSLFFILGGIGFVGIVVFAFFFLCKSV